MLSLNVILHIENSEKPWVNIQPILIFSFESDFTKSKNSLTDGEAMTKQDEKKITIWYVKNCPNKHNEKDEGRKGSNNSTINISIEEELNQFNWKKERRVP